ncbi:MAG: hypothetical protein H6606_01025 [Flavobacteriales bacterium]|nr:hypothetical protein [Flavobacteriales bacterium]
MLKEISLFLHFIGLAMGLGTSFAFMFLGMAASKLEPDDRLKFMKQIMSLSRMGHIGLALLLLSGLGLLAGRWDLLSTNYFFMAKMLLFLLLSALIGITSSAGKKFAKGDVSQAYRIQRVGKFTMPIALLIVALAVYIFK